MSIKTINAVAVEKLKGSFFGILVIRAGGLAEITAPGGVVFYHKALLFFGKLALFLGYGREAIVPLAAENARGASSLTCAAIMAGDYLTERRFSKLLCRNVGYHIADEYVCAVFFVNEKSAIACYSQTADEGGVSLGYRAMVAEYFHLCRGELG